VAKEAAADAEGKLAELLREDSKIKVDTIEVDIFDDDFVEDLVEVFVEDFFVEDTFVEDILVEELETLLKDGVATEDRDSEDKSDGVPPREVLKEATGDDTVVTYDRA
jgi:hypothetical protein